MPERGYQHPSAQRSPPQRFYDDLAERYHLVYPDWEQAVARQGETLSRLIAEELGAGPKDVLDCACGIGTQSLGLAERGHRVAGSDLSPGVVSRAAREASRRNLALRTAVADMRAVPFLDAAFDVAVCADNALPHLLTAPDLDAALAGMRRVLRPGGLLLVSTRDYDTARASRPEWRPPLVVPVPGGGRAVTFQLWHWHEDAERYDVELFQLLPEGDSWSVHVVRGTYWALTREELTARVTVGGFRGARWLEPAQSGFFQPLLTARA